MITQRSMCIQTSCTENDLQGNFCRQIKACGKCSFLKRKPVGYTYTEMTIGSIRLLLHLKRDMTIHVSSRWGILLNDKFVQKCLLICTENQYHYSTSRLRRDFVIQGTKSASISVERSGFQYSVVLFSEIKFPKHLGMCLLGSSRSGLLLKRRWAKGDSKAHGGTGLINKVAPRRNRVGLVTVTRISRYCSDRQASLWWQGKSIAAR